MKGSSVLSVMVNIYYCLCDTGCLDHIYLYKYIFFSDFNITLLTYPIDAQR